MLKTPSAPLSRLNRLLKRLPSSCSAHQQTTTTTSTTTTSTTTRIMTTDATLPTAPTPAFPTRPTGHLQKPMLASQRAADAAAQSPNADPATKNPAAMAYFPLGYKDAVSQWWTSVSSRQAERDVLSFIPFLKEANTEAAQSLNELAKTDPFGQRVWRTSMVQLSGKGRALNELSIQRVGEQADNTLVMLHGYGAGLGFFYKNFEPLSRLKGWQLYALDMLGMGNSARPNFKVTATDPKEKIKEAEAWFVDSLEEWRRARQIEKFTLMGHSLGGYLAVSYAIKYPGHLNKLILASPVGIPEDPWAVNDALPEPTASTMENEFTQDQESITRATAPTAPSVPPKKSPAAPDTPPKRPLPGWLVWLWDANVSPFSIVRLAGPLGPRFVSGWTSRRFNHLPPAEKDALHSYAYSLFRQRGSGEYALPYLLAPGAYARSPVINRIADVGRQEGESGVPVVFMYGEHDWMDVAGGYAAEERIKRRMERAVVEGTEQERRREGGGAKVLIVRRAGHHLYLDNPGEFNEMVTREMEETAAEEKRRARLGL
ncbi:Alpha/Beta hydrolase protein [Podospora conica]|nr:Alpha/Beta hydrolase protein [Schizothecium conicum]